MSRLFSKGTSPRKVMLVLSLWVVCLGFLATRMALIGTVMSYSVMAVFIVAMLAMLFWIGALFRSISTNKQSG